MEEKTIISFDGTKIFYKIKKQSKPYLVLLHGGSGSSHSWLFQQPNFLENSYSLIIPDQRGHGRSGRSRQFDFYNITNYSRDINSILEQEGISQVTLIGHSLGGQIAQEFYSKYPDKVTALVLISSKFIDPRPSIILHFVNFLLYFVFYLPFFGKPSSNYTDYRKYTQTADLNPLRIFSDIKVCSLKTYAATLIVGNNFNNRDYANIKVPTLLLHGKQDLILSYAEMEKVSKQHENFYLESLETNHITLLNQPSVVNQKVLEFLSRI